MDLLECQWCKAQNPPDRVTCATCGAPLDDQVKVTDSGWKEAPRLRDLTEFGFSSSTCQVSGEIVPVAELSLAEGDGVFFEHHVMLWKDPALALTLMDSGGGAVAGVQRMAGGMPHFLNLATGPGRLAFSRNFAGQLVVLPVHASTELDVREHAFLAGTHSLQYSYVRLKGLTSALHGGDGMFMDRFVTSGESGLLLLHGTGNVFERTLGDRETIMVEPGAFLYKDSSVDIKVAQQKVRTGLVTHEMFLAEMTGPGRVGIQSIYVHHGQ